MLNLLGLILLLVIVLAIVRSFIEMGRELRALQALDEAIWLLSSPRRLPELIERMEKVGFDSQILREMQVWFDEATEMLSEDNQKRIRNIFVNQTQIASWRFILQHLKMVKMKDARKDLTPE